MSESLSVFGRNLRRLRARSGLTQESLARASGVARETIANHEVGMRSSADTETLLALARALGVGVEEFFRSGGGRSRAT